MSGQPYLPTPNRPAGFTPSFNSDKNVRKRVKVLVVDDLADNADTLCALIEAHGYSARTAYNVRAGLCIAYEWMPSVIIHDLAMPGMTGFDALRTLRADPRFDATTIVALSAYIGHADTALRYKGFDRLATKPMRTEELVEILEAAAREPER